MRPNNKDGSFELLVTNGTYCFALQQLEYRIQRRYVGRLGLGGALWSPSPAVWDSEIQCGHLAGAYVHDWAPREPSEQSYVLVDSMRYPLVLAHWRRPDHHWTA